MALTDGGRQLLRRNVWRVMANSCIIFSMNVPRIYLDTSVLGGCFDAEFALWSNQLIQEIRQHRFLAVLSDSVAVEMVTAPASVQSLYNLTGWSWC